ncbi:hypothetical protein VTK56DRAFT_1400 [Thermocarpiscus australiensis]
MAAHLPEGLSPDAVDTLTELTSIITKLRSAQQTSSTSAAAAAAAPGTTPSAAAAAVGAPQAPPSSSSSSVSASAPAQPTGATPRPGAVTGTTPLPSGPFTSTSTSASATTTTATGTPLLSVKELPAATDNLKHKLQRARAAMRTLADVQRGVGQQEAEMARLEARRRRQAGMLARTQEDGLQFVRAAAQRSQDEEGEGEGDRMVVE